MYSSSHLWMVAVLGKSRSTSTETEAPSLSFWPSALSQYKKGVRRIWNIAVPVLLHSVGVCDMWMEMRVIKSVVSASPVSLIPLVALHQVLNSCLPTFNVLLLLLQEKQAASCLSIVAEAPPSQRRASCLQMRLEMQRSGWFHKRAHELPCFLQKEPRIRLNLVCLGTGYIWGLLSFLRHHDH